MHFLEFAVRLEPNSTKSRERRRDDERGSCCADGVHFAGHAVRFGTGGGFGGGGGDSALLARADDGAGQGEEGRERGGVGGLGRRRGRAYSLRLRRRQSVSFVPLAGVADRRARSSGGIGPSVDDSVRYLQMLAAWSLRRSLGGKGQSQSSPDQFRSIRGDFDDCCFLLEIAFSRNSPPADSPLRPQDCPDRYFCELCRPGWHGPGGSVKLTFPFPNHR